MNKISNSDARKIPHQSSHDRPAKVCTLSLQPYSSYAYHSSAMPFSKATSRLAMTIVALCGFAAFATPTQAAFNIPTDMPKSPLCIGGTDDAHCAKDFTAKLLQFEEFATESMDSPSTNHSPTDFPAPIGSTSDPADTSVCRNAPDGKALDEFLKDDLYHPSTEDSNEVDISPWQAQIQFCVGSSKSPAEGRPPNLWFAHQRFNEFKSERYFQTALGGSRANGGMRDGKQLHDYKKGEFGPGGLYYVDFNKDGKPGTKGLEIKWHPNLPVQLPEKVWTFDGGTLPPKLLMARYGEPLLFRNYNALPIDVSHNGGFGRHTITTHEHNGHNPAESDGFAHAYFYPGQYYDYHWPMVLAGTDSINPGATDWKAGSPDGNGGINRVPGDWRETMSTHWFHDHMADYTAQNVYKGNAAMMNYYSALDRGREPANLYEAQTGKADVASNTNPGYACNYGDPAIKDPKNPPNVNDIQNVNLCFPSGTDLDWGNRSYDMNLVVADKAWDNAGQLKFNIFNASGFLGDRATVNFQYKPTVDVRARKYRFRILNGSVSRMFKLGIFTADGKPVNSWMVGNDGNIMQHAVKFPRPESEQSLWPEQGIAERLDIIVDFAAYKPKSGAGPTKLYLVNLMEHTTAEKDNRVVPMSDILSGKYIPENNDPIVGKIMEFQVQSSCAEGKTNPDGSCQDFSMNPDLYIAKDDPIQGKGNLQMIPVPFGTQTERQAAKHRTFEFNHSGATELTPWAIKTDGGESLNFDPHRVSAAPVLNADPTQPGKVEIWHIKGSNAWTHPVHVHFEEGHILKRGGKTPPQWEKYARKDMYRVGPYKDATDSVDMEIRFREFAGTYVEHCHNTQHEDKAMLLRWDNEHAGQASAIPAPMPEWDGVVYETSDRLPTAQTGDVAAKKSFVLP